MDLANICVSKIMVYCLSSLNLTVPHGSNLDYWLWPISAPLDSTQNIPHVHQLYFAGVGLLRTVIPYQAAGMWFAGYEKS